MLDWTLAPGLRWWSSYDVPFKFTGKINKLSFKLEPEPQTQGKN